MLHTTCAPAAVASWPATATADLVRLLEVLPVRKGICHLGRQCVACNSLEVIYDGRALQMSIGGEELCTGCEAISQLMAHNRSKLPPA